MNGEERYTLYPPELIAGNYSHQALFTRNGAGKRRKRIQQL